MYQFTTASDTTFVVEDSRITRRPSPYVPPEVSFERCPTIVAERFRWEAPPVVGEQAVFISRSGGRVETSIVTRIVRDADVSRLPWGSAPEMGPPTF